MKNYARVHNCWENEKICKNCPYEPKPMKYDYITARKMKLYRKFKKKTR